MDKPKPCGHREPCDCLVNSIERPLMLGQPSARLREGPGVGFHVEPEQKSSDDSSAPVDKDAAFIAPRKQETLFDLPGGESNGRISALDAAEMSAKWDAKALGIELPCTCPGGLPDPGTMHVESCPRWRPPEDPFASSTIGDTARKLMLEQAKARENVARSAVTYVLDEMGRAIDTIRHSVLEQPEKLIESRNQRRAAIRKDIEHVFALSGEDAESHQRLISNLVATLIWNGWTKSKGGA